MKVVRPFLAAAALLPLFAATASAGLLENRDAESHRVTFEQGSGRATTDLEAKKSIRFRCSDFPCRITLEESGASLELRSDEQDVAIEGGRLQIVPERQSDEKR